MKIKKNRFSRNTALIIIDVQKGFDDPVWGTRNNPDAESNIAALLEAWRNSGRPIIHIQHNSLNTNSPLHPDSPGNAIKEIVKPGVGERVITKSVNSAFIGTGLEEYLRDKGYETLVITGLTTNHCVSTTARMAANLGFKTYVVSDAVAAFDLIDHIGKHYTAEEIHDISLANLHDEFAEILDSQSVLADLELR